MREEKKIINSNICFRCLQLVDRYNFRAGMNRFIFGNTLKIPKAKPERVQKKSQSTCQIGFEKLE